MASAFNAKLWLEMCRRWNAIKRIRSERRRDRAEATRRRRNDEEKGMRERSGFAEAAWVYTSERLHECGNDKETR